MPNNEAIRQLIEARGAGIKEASEKRDVDMLMSWHAKDATFTNVFQGIHLEGIDQIRGMYTQAYQAIPKFKIIDPQATGTTPDFLVTEMTCEGTVAMDLPQAGWKQGDTVVFKGLSLFWFRWEGPGEEWDGSLSDEAVRGWKIYRERAYYQTTVKGGE